MTDLEHLVDLERDGWEALSSGRGGAYYRQHLADDAVMAFPFGVLAREESIAAVEAAQPWASWQMHAPRVVALTSDSGTVVYRVTAQRAGQEPWTAVISSTYVRRDGSWQLALHQQSPS